MLLIIIRQLNININTFNLNINSIIVTVTFGDLTLESWLIKSKIKLEIRN